MAVVASRKLGGAVTRNRAKRLLRVALASPMIRGPDSKAQILKRFYPAHDHAETSRDGMCGIWIVAIARNEILSAKSADVRDELEHLLQ